MVGAYVVAAASLALLATAKKAQGPIISPEVRADRTVTFRFTDPAATKVEVELEGQPSLAMAKDKHGIWTATSSPLPPNYYGYSFNADGLNFVDPGNPYMKPNLLWQSSIVLVPGDPPELWEVRDVTHGTVHHHFYNSEIIGAESDYYVYTPPGYDAKSAKKYPVLYLLHGYSDMASAWTEVGKANVIMDNLISEGRVTPMLVVMPLGYGVPGFASRGSKAFGDRSLTKRNFDNFRSTLLVELIPRIQQEYRVSADQKDRAIAGLSMGGAESLYVGINNVDKFAFIGAFSSGGLPVTSANQSIDSGDLAQCFPELDAANVNKHLKRLYISCGTSDGLIGFKRGFVSWLDQQKIKVQAVETSGMHEWPVWRRNLIEFSQLIFR